VKVKGEPVIDLQNNGDGSTTFDQNLLQEIPAGAIHGYRSADAGFHAEYIPTSRQQ